MLHSVEALLDHLRNQSQLNVVLGVNRPFSLWRKLFSSIEGHACNLVKMDQTVYLVDVQKNVSECSQ